jgi:hypothetical protein
MPKCTFCLKEFKPVPSKQSKSSSRRTICNSCAVSKRRWKSKIELIQKLGNKCNRCGYDGHPGVFHFHHKDPKQKLHEINGNKLLTKDRHEEIKKCELLCANCHHIEHSNNELIKKFGFIVDKEKVL